jgi:hypothetical protein
MLKCLAAVGVLLSLTSCGDAPYDPRGVEPDETLLCRGADRRLPSQA